MINIEKILPVYRVQNDCTVSGQGDLTIAFRVSHMDIFSASGNDYDALHHSWLKALKVLPPHTVVHKQDYFVHSAHQGGPAAEASFLTRKAAQEFDGRVFLNHHSYLMLTKIAPGRREASSGYSTLMRKTIVPSQVLDERLLMDFEEKTGAFVQILSDGGLIRLTRLSDDELAGTPRSAGIIEQYCFLQQPDAQPLLRDVHLKEGIRIGEERVQVFGLSDLEQLPSLCGSRITYDKYSTDKTRFSIGFASHLGMLLDCNHMYNQYLFIGDSQQALKSLERKRLRLQSLSAYSRENAIAAEATAEFLNEAIASQRIPVKAHFNLMVWTSDPAKMQELRNQAGAAMAAMDTVAKQETDGAPQIWWAGIPGNAADFPMNDTFDTFLEQAACFLNMETNCSSATSGIRFGDRSFGRPVNVDLFDEPMKTGLITNRNLFICGGSGGGKSMAMNHMLRSLYDQGTHCVTIDIGGSYKGLCELLGGYYFTYTEADPICFNPFYITHGDVLDIEKKESLKTLLLALWKKENEPFNRSEYVAVSGAITGYYEHLDAHQEIFAGFDSFYEFLLNVYAGEMELGKVQQKDFDIRNFLYVLRPYYRGGEFDYLLNATENLDLLNERFIVFELDNIKSHEVLFPVVTIIIMEMFISKMRKLKGMRKILAIDEAWVAIAKSGMAEFIKYLYKTVRKFNGIAALITQEVEDLISSPIIKETVINLSDTKILLDMRKFMNKFDQLQQVLGLSDKAKTMLLSLNKANQKGAPYRELFIDQGGQRMGVYRNELCLEEYLAYTTEESEKIRVMEYAARFGSIEKGIAALAAELRNQSNSNRLRP